MKKFLILILLAVMTAVTYGQYTTIANEKFTSVPSGWSVSPTGGWAINTTYSVSTPSSILGYVPNSLGDSVVLISPYYNLTSYGFVFLRFSQICKVSACDICKIYIQENYTGAKWKEIPSSCYRGANSSAYISNRFSQQSYTDWVPSDSLATPTNSWWKNETFDISSEASYASVRFRFVIKRGNVAWTQFAYGWLIDNFELTASTYQIAPPTLEILSTSPKDTIYNTGPFTVSAKIISRTVSPIKTPVNLNVKYIYNNITTYDTIPMTKIAGDTIWSAVIPQKLFGTSISYDIYVADTFGNNASTFSSFYIKRFTGGSFTGYVTIGSQVTTISTNIFNYDYDYGWSRQLYLGTEIDPAGKGGLITKIAFKPTATWNISNQTCYLKAVSDASISSGTYVDPILDGYTLGWAGTYSMTASTWSEIMLNAPFVLPPGKNLVIYWTNQDGSYINNTATSFYATNTSPTYRAVYRYTDNSFPTSSGTLYYYRPDVRLFVESGNEDSNSVALHSINIPQDSVVAAPGHQVPVVVTIKNSGVGILDSCIINWTLNGVLKTPYKWKGSLSSNFTIKDTIGYYYPSLNVFDTLVVWVGMPNGELDTLTQDDTLSRVAYGVTGLNMEFLNYVWDTVNVTGPFQITALISSRTTIPVPSPVYLHVFYTYNSITTHDSLIMTKYGNDTFDVFIPQRAFGTDIKYYILLTDAVGNKVSLSDSCFIKLDESMFVDTNSVALYSIDKPNGSVSVTPLSAPQKVQVTIKNVGIANLVSCNLGWSLNGVFQGTKAWTGNLTSDFNDTITVGYYTPRGCNYDDIKVWVYNPNNVLDPYNYDDTLSTLIYANTGIVVNISGPVDTVYKTGPFKLDIKIISLTKSKIDTNVFVNLSYFFLGNTVYDTIRMTNTGNDTLFTTLIPQQPYGSYITYTFKLQDSLHNNITINKWFYIKRPNLGIQLDSTIVGAIINGGVFVTPFDCRYAVSYSRVIYTGTEIGVVTSGAVLNSISWFSYQGAGYTYNAARTNQKVYLKAVSNTTTTISSGSYINPIADGATLVWSGTMNLKATPGTWHKINLNTPFVLPANSNLIVYYTDEHGTASSTFAWTYQTVTNSCAFGSGTSLSNITSQTLASYKPFTCFGYNTLTNDSNGVAAFTLLSPQAVTTAGVTTPVQVVIKNKGINNLTSCNIDWTLNGIAQTQYHWTGNLFETFTDTIILGTYLPNPNNYDKLKIWVSLPNGYADTTNWDDTLNINAYGKAGLIAEYVAPLINDTVYSTGPFTIYAHIQSLTQTPVNSATMNLTYNYNNNITNGSLQLINLFPDSLWKVNIPQQAFGTKVIYSIPVIDSIGNLITITDSFYVKRPGSKDIIDSLQVGTSITNGDLSFPFTTNGSGTNWSRSLYLSRFMGNANTPVTIAGISYVTDYNYSHTRYFTKCYLKATTTTVINTSSTYISPETDGATLVYTGTWTTKYGWNQFIFDTPFVLPKGYNLLVYWDDTSSLNVCNSSSYVYWANNLTSNLGANYTAVNRKYTNYACSNSGSGSTTYLPTTRFFYGGPVRDSNSVALIDIISPADTVQSYQTLPIKIIIRNVGTKNLTSCNINWKFNNVMQPTIYWTGNLAENFYDTITISSFYPVKGNTYTFYFDVTLPNNAYDSTTYDNSLTQVTFAEYKGKNLTMKQFNSPVNNVYDLCYPDFVSVNVKVENSGSMAIMMNTTPVTLNYNVSGPVNYQKTITLSKGNFAVGTKDVIVDTNLNISLPGIYHIEVIVKSTVDTLNFDDTLRMDYTVNKILLPYDQDFSTLTSDFSLIQNAGYVKWQQNLTPSIPTIYGTGALYFNSALTTGQVSMARLKSINLKGTLYPKVEFWFAHDTLNSNKADRVEVKVSTNGYTFTSLDTVYRYNSSFAVQGWEHYTVDLSSYSSQSCVILAFVATSAGGGDMWIDRVVVNSAKEIGLEFNIPAEDSLIACELDHKELKVKVQNNTLLPIDFSETPVYLTLEVTGAVSKVYMDTLTGILEGDSTLEVLLDNNFDFSTSGNYSFRAYINSIDNNTSNDTILKDITIFPDVQLVSMDAIGKKDLKSQVYPTFLLRNVGNLKIKEIPIHVQVNGGNDIIDIAYVDLAPGQDSSYTLNTPFIVPIEPTYSLTSFVALTCDNQNNNDTLKSTEYVNDPALRVKSILRPAKTPCDTGLTVIYPQITLENTGSAEIDIVVYLIVDTASTVYATLVDTIAFVLNGTTNYNFKKSYIVPDTTTNSTYNLTAYIYSPTYKYMQTACVIKKPNAIIDTEKDRFMVGQNIPNPAQTSVKIPYSIPNDGEVIFKLVSVSGQSLYQNTIQVSSGMHEIELNIADFANGIYYYSMEYKGSTIVKKITIQK